MFLEWTERKWTALKLYGIYICSSWLLLYSTQPPCMFVFFFFIITCIWSYLWHRFQNFYASLHLNTKCCLQHPGSQRRIINENKNQLFHSLCGHFISYHVESRGIVVLAFFVSILVKAVIVCAVLFEGILDCRQYAVCNCWCLNNLSSCVARNYCCLFVCNVFVSVLFLI